MNKLFCDVLIFGAGIIGASLALRLAQAGIKVYIIDCHKLPILIENYDIPNNRVSAINYKSVEFFKNINVWTKIPTKFRIPYQTLKVWECPRAMVTFHAKTIGLSDMGCIIENNRLKLALWNSIINSVLITLYCPFKLVSLKYKKFFWECTLNDNTVINSRLLIGADGINSQIRKELGIKITSWKFNQYCMLLIIKTESSQQGTIWQKFTPTGPIGFLPLYDNWGSLMWFNTNEYIYNLRNLPKFVLENRIRHNCYEQLGNITLHSVVVVPLINQYANSYITWRGALIGDAAHVIHPLAGQGINLGIRDVIKLSELLINLNGIDQDIYTLKEILKIYQNSRKFDVYLMQNTINCLYFIFHNNFLPLKIIRNIAFLTTEKLSYIKRKILQYATGTFNFM